MADIALYSLESGCPCNFGNLDASTLSGEVQNDTLVVSQLSWLTLFKVRIDADCRLALHFQSRGNSRFIDFAHRAQVVVGNPLPKVQLGMTNDGFVIECAQNLFYIIALGFPVVQAHHNSSENLFTAEGNQYPHAD